MLNRSPMLRLRVPFLVVAVAGALGVPGLAWGQTVNLPTGVYPTRTQPYRPQNLNPQGVNYNDCINDMSLTFNLNVNGFAGQNLAVYAALNSDCTSAADRGTGGVSGQLCWKLDGGFVGRTFSSTTPVPVTVRVQDVMAHMDGNVPFSSAVTHGDASSCAKQSSPVGTSLQIDFVPLNSDGVTYVGTAFQYTLNVDVLGPPAPTGIGKSVGHTLINVTWSPNSDTDTAGYDVFIDPAKGQEGSDGSALTADSSTITVCDDSGSSSGDDAGDAADGATDGGDDGSADAAVADGSTDATVADAATPDAGTPDAGATSSTDASCHTINHGGGSTGNACTSTLLTSGFVSDAGTTTVIEASTSDDGGDDSSTGTTTSGPGGISTIPDANRVGNSPTISDKSQGQYQITGLVDGQIYNIVVASVDGYGNVGAASTEVCDFPQPVQDFWGSYESDGGKAGGFCALDRVGGGAPSLAGVAGVLAATAIVRRRRRKP